jgi:hypothetical protein
MLEPTSGLEPLTCRLRIVRFGGTQHNLNHYNRASVSNLTQSDLIRQFRDSVRDTIPRTAGISA